MANTKQLRIKRRFAVMLEDAVSVELPAHIDPDDSEAINEWAFENYDRLYCAAKDGEPGVSLDWEDEHKYDLDFPETEKEAEILDA